MNEPQEARTPKLIEAAQVKNGRGARNSDKSRESQLGVAGSAVTENKSQQLAARLRGRILDLARTADKVGLTINEAERQIENHKGHSVSPRFAELVKQGYLVRVLVGHGPLTKRFARGSPRFFTRYDEETRRNVNVHWVPEFAPASTDLRDASSDTTSTRLVKTEGVRV
jgi:hypothetical protein